MKMDESQLDILIKEVLDKILEKSASAAVTGSAPASAKSTEVSEISEFGVFECMGSAIKAAKAAQIKLSFICLDKRKELISAMREAVYENVQELATLAVEETGMGRVKDKVQKNLLAARKTPGVEDISPSAFTGDHGLTLVERAQFGVF
ncbi:MAG: hypothetical protein Q7J78_03685 [Clostridiales bacterium]|nr:hypothetical protein [Clostridiales bacterium]